MEQDEREAYPPDDPMRFYPFDKHVADIPAERRQQVAKELYEDEAKSARLFSLLTRKGPVRKE